MYEFNMKYVLRGPNIMRLICVSADVVNSMS